MTHLQVKQKQNKHFQTGNKKAQKRTRGKLPTDRPTATGRRESDMRPLPRTGSASDLRRNSCIFSPTRSRSSPQTNQNQKTKTNNTPNPKKRKAYQITVRAKICPTLRMQTAEKIGKKILVQSPKELSGDKPSSRNAIFNDKNWIFF